MKVRIGKPGRKNKAHHVDIDDHDVWNLDYTLACVIHPALVRMKEKKHGYPELWEDGMVTTHNYDRQLHFDFIDEQVENDYLQKKWDNILDKMTRAFGMIVHKEDWEKSWESLSWEKSREEEVKYYQTIDEGLALFAEHYHSLWD